jgi:hypothetical protein
VIKILEKCEKEANGEKCTKEIIRKIVGERHSDNKSRERKYRNYLPNTSKCDLNLEEIYCFRCFAILQVVK